MIKGLTSLNRNELAALERSMVARCREGDKEAIEFLIAKHRTRLVRISANILRDPHEAEDVTQEAFIKGFREIHRLREDRAFSGYLYRIAVRLCMDRLRSRKPEGEFPELGDGGNSSKIEMRILVERLLKQLSPDLRTTLVLREMEQLSYDEVADVMNVPVGTVRSRLHTARARFREIWLDATGESR